MEKTRETKNERFPKSFWTANLTELFERGAYYAMASFVVLYLGQLGLGDYWPSNLNGVLWALVFFLPILSGSIADQIGFKKSMLIAFGFLAAGYFTMGYPVWFGGQTLNPSIGSEMTAGIGVLLPIISAIIFIGIGGSIIKPCIAGTVQKTAGSRATLGFGIFYMIINIGSLLGRGVSYVIRKEFDLSYIFAVSVFFSILAFFAVLLFYTEPKDLDENAAKKPRKSILKILADMVLVLRNLRFALFMIVSSGFFIIYSQVYNVLPLYLQKVVELDPAVDLVTMANPFVIVFFQLLITKKFGKMKPIKSIIVGIIIIGISMMINLIPIFMDGGVRKLGLGDAIPLGTIFITLTVGLIAFGELFTSARTYEYVGALAPKGQEGLFLGYANLPLAIGAIVGGPAGAFIFHDIMCKNAVELDSGLLELSPFWNSMGWVILMAIGFVSAFSMWLYNRWLQKNPV